MAKWIWYFGDFEFYHNGLLHNRRVEYGGAEPPVWKVFRPEETVWFRKSFTTKGGSLKVYANCHAVVYLQDRNSGKEMRYNLNAPISVKEGSYTVTVRTSNPETFPAIFVEGVVASDSSWEADDLTLNWKKVGFWDKLNDPRKSPEDFPFSYEKISYVNKEILPDGVLFDFGTETFAKCRFSNLCSEYVTVRFGESRAEALDPVWSVIRFEEAPVGGCINTEPCAFRYVFVSDAMADVVAEYEYLFFEQRGEFRCGEELINRIWDIAAYTFHLNSREFFLDGIKRDRWVWAGDAYQSLFVNQYLFYDADIVKRTLIALGGKRPFERHINTINDYTFLWVMSIMEYYRTYGDLGFVGQIYPQLKEVMAFCLAREDQDGFVREKEGDWIFIDWASMDKSGALCAEQILYAKALEEYSAVCVLLGEDDSGTAEKSRKLQRQIIEKFYVPDRSLFIDSYESGSNYVSRHSNILAFLYLPLTAQQKEGIYEKVILNDEVEQITTPYFKFYENMVHCEMGDTKLLEASLRNYYGDMLKTGATSLYEQFDPTQSGNDIYAMYGRPYAKSLCHAWSTSPIYLLARYRLGIKNTGIAYDHYEITPNRGDLGSFSGKVQVPGGVIAVSVKPDSVSVYSDIEGGTLIMDGKRYEILAKKEISVKAESETASARRNK